MEFLELLMVLIAMIIIIAKPEKEKLAFTLVVASWLLMIFLYMGDKSTNLLTHINL
ncbi:dihydroneopterin aldolase [Campylobacter pinnipediorum]|uniref:DsbI-accessory protein Dba n=2 Tax=Campylobacter pinnipediorum TaxID=1965231 RepID=A0A1S6U673_9BACT|nr:dihydroneopterin aldolase [Campylobacter pinnipediorum]AQW80656.1 DsbI-accessory protein Dba [Campylobacter pinnipediorum subsp. pinnipediorum]AQW82324.1 DsbI-accessory protein Dba [Campylobacter pinnipediorum subsp. pinnipediorum]AQW83996.1 DsbI-accessory protein Dba [Campylobacter pinnipediorum subsp. pinnipediorum]AQW85639.1 DsbI-accessory protein Dba [Campylobacter pinnipediorum subsp. caledonicus]AQW87248.1 DsbI-accessory protein Dba [Campylobacter pinnipediorum subsp. caledonicus]